MASQAGVSRERPEETEKRRRERAYRLGLRAARAFKRPVKVYRIPGRRGQAAGYATDLGVRHPERWPAERRPVQVATVHRDGSITRYMLAGGSVEIPSDVVKRWLLAVGPLAGLGQSGRAHFGVVFLLLVVALIWAGTLR